MSTDSGSLEQALSSVDVASVRVPPGGVSAAVDEFTDGPTVGVPLERADVTLPDSVAVDPTPAALRDATTGVTPAAFAVLDYGSLVLPSTPPGVELVSLFVDRHVVVLDGSDVVEDMEAAFERLGTAIPDAYRDGVLATGPSATADMGELVIGAHGPSEVRAVVVED